MRQLMQQQLALFATRMRRQHLAAQLTEFSEPWPNVRRKLLIDLAPQSLRKGGALTTRRDGDLQIAAVHHGAKEEIAVRNVVNRVARNSSFQCRPVDGVINIRN